MPEYHDEVEAVFFHLLQESGDEQCALRDLLTEVRHLAAAKNLDFYRALDGSYDVYLEEREMMEEVPPRWANLLNILDWKGDQPVDSVPMQENDEGAGDFTPDSIERYLIVQRHDYDGTFFLIDCDTIEQLQDELADRLDEDGWLISGVYDLDTAESLRYDISVTIRRS